MIRVGRSYTLDVVKVVEFGVYVDAKELGEVLVPNRYLREKTVAGDKLDVFIYLDSKDRYIATTQKPRAQLGEFAYLNVVDCNDVGAFLDWGLDKDVLVPFGEQHRPMEVGKSYLVYLYLDRIHGRITASSKIDKFILDDQKHRYKAKQKVNVIIANTTDLGYRAIINNHILGLFHNADVFERLSFGDKKVAFIKDVRPDGRINLTFAGGQETRDKYSRMILSALEKNSGHLSVHDKSSPDEIKKLFGMSKAAFKKAIGGLYKQRLISIDSDGIRLLEK
ncbi:Conserved virulence factor B [Sinobacterium norvegicum]|uniref:Conserved virulence factor B n=1 Tax=Sinobacterium norvegicum TaxID=1641715 RepID=A0ABM9AHH3_9GAMM|nr:S1-like domain-containing RNA-binding protein [Sinobacterium norvegicum]CAH0992665.1 Conserved virulence factor B [Sinobacterium norvegicum]